MLKSVLLICFGFALSNWGIRRREDQSLRSHIDVLGAEIRYCGFLAATYLHENVRAPLYRLPVEAYREALPALLRGGVLRGDDANTLQRFYLQVDQVNRGLDNVDDFVRGRIASVQGQMIMLEDDERRLKAKAEELRGPHFGESSADLYREAVVAFENIVWHWQSSSIWRRFSRHYVRPAFARVRARIHELGWFRSEAD